MSIDPWIGIRHALHLFHPNSPLSHPQLTRRAFFTPGSPESAVADVHAHLCPYESLRWPVGQMFPFVRRPELVVRRIGGWTKAPSDRMLVLYGAQDTLMNRPVNEKLARMYRDAAAKLNGAGPKENAVESSGVAEKTAKTTGKWTSEHGVRLASVEGAGHHLQNEPGKPMQDGLKQLVTWYEQL